MRLRRSLLRRSNRRRARRSSRQYDRCETMPAMTVPRTLDDAILLAAKVHAGVTDKGGSPYILHPLRVMMRVTTVQEQMAAVLHDVVEDDERYGTTFASLRSEGYPPEVVDALECLTKRDGEDYDAFVQRAKANPIARRVKPADIEDNMDVRRLGSIGPKEAERLEKYRRAWTQLNRLLNLPRSAPASKFRILAASSILCDAYRGRSRGRSSRSSEGWANRCGLSENDRSEAQIRAGQSASAYLCVDGTCG